LHAALDKVQVPVLLLTGWQDLFLEQTMYQYQHLRARGVDVGLTVGPWTHAQMTFSGDATRDALDWLSHHLAGAPLRRPAPVRHFVTDGGGWHDLPEWPPAAEPKVLYLQPLSALAGEPPANDAAPSRFVFDPADPTPTVGGRLLSPRAGHRNDGRLANRGDVLTFTGPVLTEDTEVIGVPYVELAHSTDIPHADVSVRLSDVDAKGRSRSVSDGYLRLKPDRPALLRIDLDAMAHRFGAGHRIRLMIAGGSHPRYSRNLGTDEPPLTGERLVPSTHTVAHGTGGVSRLVLPVPPRA
jgi:putative CocE/NonD family hydrolase